MSTIINKIEEILGFRVPDRSEVVRMTEAEQQELKTQLRAAIPDEAMMAEMPSQERQAVIDQVFYVASAIPGPMIREAMPSNGQPALIVQGEFKGGEGNNEGSGQALIYEFPDGNRTLRLQSFYVSNGPALHVLLASNSSPANKDDLGTTLDLGSLMSNQGDQNYEIPVGTDLAPFKSIVIFCKMFSVVIATATLG